jgi:hypothetical protein
VPLSSSDGSPDGSAIGIFPASAADLKFLHHLRQTPSGTSKSKSGTRIIELLVPMFEAGHIAAHVVDAVLT